MTTTLETLPTASRGLVIVDALDTLWRRIRIALLASEARTLRRFIAGLPQAERDALVGASAEARAKIRHNAAREMYLAKFELSEVERRLAAWRAMP
ncbi:MAG: hypothetical protein JO142_02130 [Burkholderiales bacterium]|nr:hypothetical protein [Burkholderiales bacterium]